MSRVDPFTRKRIERFIDDFRGKTGQIPTLEDFAQQGIEKATIEAGLKDGFLLEVYVTLTNGVVKKGYKPNLDAR